MQLNVEGLTAAKRHIIESLAEIHHIDVICLQETHVNDLNFRIREEEESNLQMSTYHRIEFYIFMPIAALLRQKWLRWVG